MLRKLKINMLLNIVLSITLIGYTYSWMVTEPSYGEIVNYNRELIVASSGVDVEIYMYSDGDYQLYEGDDIILDNLAPNDTIRFKFVMTNTNRTTSLTDIIFANIYGDVDVISPYISINCVSPGTFSKNLHDNLLTTATFDGLKVTNYIKFYDDLSVSSNSSETIYWTLSFDKSASNDVADKSLKIDNIVFLNG